VCLIMNVAVENGSEVNELGEKVHISS
jgi:hypothetical protein